MRCRRFGESACEPSKHTLTKIDWCSQEYYKQIKNGIEIFSAITFRACVFTTLQQQTKASSIATVSAPKRSARSKATAAVATRTGVGRTERRQKAASQEGDMAEDRHIRSRVGEVQAKYGQELRFLVSEFTQLEAQLAPAVEACNSVRRRVVHHEAGRSGLFGNRSYHFLSRYIDGFAV